MTGRTRRDLCPGLLRPWIADDGALIRVRIPGGVVSLDALGGLLEVARAHGDGTVHVTSRANLQVRAIPHDDGCLADEVVDAVMATGLMPSTSHERIRNIMASPLTGRSGGRADLRPVVAELDRRICAEPGLAGLAGRFLFVLDDGRGDLTDRDLDLGIVALDADTAQVRVGAGAWGPVVSLASVAETLTRLAARFVELAGAQSRSPWHVDELPGGGATLLPSPSKPRPGTRVSSPPSALGRIAQVDGRVARHLPVPDGRIDAHLFDEVRSQGAGSLVVTPWRTLIVPDLENA